ncbi:WS/DGAT/MGAT family O-acyltransferase [Nocardioides daphniae]|uniref:Diacylglycerol O-acyltransferase n=1 Tax=Nocardioides daphniae TaxID=402297 RepID=A0A4P7UAR9_9ACTN|nr:wax ester/triacylglycerol synthase family O-acyltransferase [Nocardioides daphniae]QCC76691.1 wax ester/triacylglycerol synthase family O-acyltransferase [Nocardioides daphniae]GGD15388.1 diacylglycerol O-acyltransferase [Nocardioides daphniae]
MTERLRPRDLAFLATDSPSTPMHNATLEVFESGTLDHARALELVQDRISYVPRYRQRLQYVPGQLANPLWVDDTEFDLTYHVRRSALPRPGTMDQLRELTARIVSRPLDRSRPLWEVYVIEGLEEGRVAMLSKSHQILVDGVETVDLGQVVMDVDPDQGPLGLDEEWRPRRTPTPAALVLGAVADNLESPRTLLQTVRSGAGAVGRRAESVATRVGQVAGVFSSRPAAVSPVNGELSQQRRIVTVATDLADYRTIRRVHQTTVNDVVLATVTGALRGWLMTRDEALYGIKKLKAVVPMSVIDDELEATSLGTQVIGHEVNLPIGEVSPVVRLLQVSYSFNGHRETGRAVSAQRLTGIAGFAPTTFHALGSRVAARELRRGFHVSVTNVPGPQFPLYAAGAQMLETYPIHPLLPGHALAIGVTSYDGQVFYGITADRDLVPDADVLGQCLLETLEELKDTATDVRPRAPRGRKKKAVKKSEPAGRKPAQKPAQSREKK